jgi:iron complex outermembrane recepter protein
MMKQSRSFNFLTLIILMLVTTVGIPMNTMAQGGAVLEEVVVTARQRTEKLTDVPASITAFTESTLDRAGVDRAEDFIALTPGVSMVNTAEAGDSSLSIRGINGARDAETNFAFIIDGILYTNPSAFNREFSDLKQIEVLKGPQGALYGRSASAGAVIVTTGSPSNETEGSIEASYGRYNTATVKAMVSGALKEDELYGRVSIDYRDTDGQWNNALTGADSVDRFENYNVSGRLLWEANEDLTIDTKIRYGEVDAASIAFNAAFSLPAFTAFLGPDANIDVNEHEFVFSPNVRPENEQETLEASIKVDYDMDWATLTGWMLYSDQEQYFSADGTSGAFGFYFPQQTCIDSFVANTGAPVQSPTFVGPDAASSLLPPYSPTTCDGYQYQERNQEDLSFEVRLTSSGDERLRWNLGFYWLDIEREVGVAQLFDDGDPSRPLNFTNSNLDALVHDRFDTKVYSVFGALNYDVTPEIEASFALRWDREERGVSNLVPTPSQRTSTRIDYCAGLNGGAGCTLNGAPLVGTPLNPAFVTDFATGTVTDSIADRSKNFSQIQPKVSLTWDVTEDTTLFGSWGIGFKSGGFNNIGSSSTIQNFLVAGGAALVAPTDIYQKETTSAFEVGFKSQFAGGRVNVNGAAFYTEIDDMQFFEFFVGPFGLLRVVENVDEAETWGFELGTSAQITDRLNLNVGWSLIEGKIKKNDIRTYTEGNDIPNAPEYTLNAAAQYIAPAFEGIDFVGYVNYSRVGKTWFHTVQNGADNVVPATLFGGPPADFSKTRRDAYGVINLRAGFEADNWHVTGFVQNLLDRKYLAEVITAPEFGGSFVHPGTDRRYGIEVGYSFF